MIAFYLEDGSGIPAYLQLVRQVEHAIRLGRLRAGDQLPSVRDVVALLGINPNTVVKAYREMESQAPRRHPAGPGHLRRGPGRGRRGRRRIPARLARDLTDWIAAAKASGLARDDLAALFDDALHQAYPAEGVA